MTDGSVYLGGGGTVPVLPGAQIVAGFIIGNQTIGDPQRAVRTHEFVNGAGATIGRSVFGIYFGLNQAFGGATAIEIGIATPGIKKTPNPGAGAGTGAAVKVGTLPGF